MKVLGFLGGFSLYVFARDARERHVAGETLGGIENTPQKPAVSWTRTP